MARAHAKLCRKIPEPVHNRTAQHAEFASSVAPDQDPQPLIEAVQRDRKLVAAAPRRL
jgi:hypothetical protein